ncbi:MAG: WG repeat-containing protein [Prolixibacteraceae bacterium]|nr:WG repeat-containing protein [Prolixibacteraceae bacterium]
MKRTLLHFLFFILMFSSCLSDDDSALKPFSENGKWGYSDKNEKIVIPAVYDDVLPFSEGLAAVKRNNQWGYIDADGNELILPKYDKAGNFCEKRALVCINGKCGFINSKGEELIIPGKYDVAGNFSEGMAVVCIGNQYGFVDKNGKQAVELKYDYAWNFNNGLAKVMQNNRYGYIDNEGEEIIPVIYDFISGFNNNIALAKLNDKWRFIDENGNENTLHNFDTVWPADQLDFYKANKNGKYGFINNKGQEVITLKYDNAANFNSGASIVKLHEKYGLIDRKGREIVPAVYDSIFAIDQQLFVLQQGNEDVHVINPLGNANINNIDSEEIKARYVVQKEKAVKSGNITDERDGHRYGWKKVGQQSWLLSNTLFPNENSKCYREGDMDDCDTYGRYYQWETALNACPEGWKLPSLDDWQVLINELGGEETAYRVLTGSDSLSLNLKPGGYYYNETSFLNTGEYGYFWTSTPDGTDAAICIWLNPVEKSIMEFSSSTEHYRNVRCVRE